MKSDWTLSTCLSFDCCLFVCLFVKPVVFSDNTEKHGGAFGVVFLTREMDTVTRVQIPDEAVCISHGANTVGKSMNPIIVSPIMDK